MPTTAYLIYEDNKDVFHWRYHHWDGGIDFLGKTLFKIFKEEKDVNFLFDIQRNFATILISKEEDKYLSLDEGYKKADLNHKLVFYKTQIIRAFQDESPLDVSFQKFNSYMDLSKSLKAEYFYYFSKNKKEWFVKHKTSGFIPLKIMMLINLLNDDLVFENKKKFFQVSSSSRKKYIALMRKVYSSSYKVEIMKVINKQYPSISMFISDADIVLKDDNLNNLLRKS